MRLTRRSFSFSAVARFIGLMPVRFYQYCISPFFLANCRFQPSCSAYAKQAITRHGVLKGWYLACKRILRCHPWGGSGIDEVPK